MEIRMADRNDLSGWVRLVEPTRHLFPGGKRAGLPGGLGTVPPPGHRPEIG